MSQSEKPAVAVYLRAMDPFPLESPDFNKLHEFYGFLAVEARLGDEDAHGPRAHAAVSASVNAGR